ncbi:hypothetical protein SAMN04489712_12520 [Thermomonospora echinospora]|uniref:Uncharacterized protein n=1 Tax=Thermomonospora echinospora TaxID=1992 RepID=A0A1H6DZG4_9ACTN|nr:hypothetical protein [Thermomonospora echinospora]SEG90035.1 hypothetical protein SAMN04489712_12520 [Thermomonospora echinospora]
MSRQIVLGTDIPSVAALEHRVRTLESTVAALLESVAILSRTMGEPSTAIPLDTSIPLEQEPGDTVRVHG